ncbi:hypothetical protein ABW636_00340 [Aquimarina sp. 2201CG1-2-11]|uniref:hypothetical protein n=1 Tax=Aquimarina discodermiae TaxID=3231043 RepID=UPI0034622B0C
MDKIKEFIKDYINIENTGLIAKWDVTKTDEEVDVLANKLSVFLHSYLSETTIARTGLEFDLDDEEDVEFTKIKMSKFVPRTLFQIKHYKNFELGYNLSQVVTGKDLYACYVSYPSEGGRDLYFSSIFYVSDTEEGRKIIYEKSFDSKKGEWYHPHEGEGLQVLDSGDLIAVEKYHAPEEETSLADYNKE